jgi:hypothetical protein
MARFVVAVFVNDDRADKAAELDQRMPENVHALKAMCANDGDRLATARMKWIEDPILRSLILSVVRVFGTGGGLK